MSENVLWIFYGACLLYGGFSFWNLWKGKNPKRFLWEILILGGLVGFFGIFWLANSNPLIFFGLSSQMAFGGAENSSFAIGLMFVGVVLGILGHSIYFLDENQFTDCALALDWNGIERKPTD